MRRHYSALALAAFLGAATLASAQATNNVNNNPVARGPHGDYFHDPLNIRGAQPFEDAFARRGIERPRQRVHSPVTPVPEPSQWAMMAAGLVLVGFIVRRNAKRS